jgi:hypothetical protein
MAKRRYPARAIAAVAGAGVLFAFCVVTGFLFMALVPPMIPVFISVLVANACLLGRALEYATRVSEPRTTGMLPARHGSKVAPSSLTARAT